ncbi:TetR/AcrR family transcriptional regulator [Plantactinospora sp. GCM10030261]|uniref:TetR/AcrR family transcriptional regulator n=1 Tax=Plantactinospora sp. GCM10030261 TaxID=3273420 RepID=UPI00360F30D2
MSAPARPGPRDRLIQAARELTYQQGFTVGVDAILARAGVARASLYQHFGGKDGLLAEVLRTATDEQRYRDALAAGGDRPRDRLRAFFDELRRVVSQPRFHGCRYTMAALTLTDPEHPTHTEIRNFKNRIHALFEQELRDLDHPDPVFAADQLLVLTDGVMMQAVTRRGTDPGRAAKALAEMVLDQASGD